MARTKHSARGAALGLPKARFTAIKPKQRKRKSLPKLHLDLAPPAASSSSAAAGDWRELEPSLPEGSSPEVEAAVARANQLCPAPGPPPDTENVTITDLLESLTTDPPETRTPSPLPLTRSPPRSPFEAGMSEDLPPEMAPSATTTVISETVSETTSPIRAISRKVTVSAPKKHPVAAKCPRPEYTRMAPSKASKPKEQKTAKSRPTALREIKRLQREYKPVLPLAPFARAVRGVLFQFGPYRLTRDALEALRCATEQYGLDTFQSANLLTRHRDRATLLPKDIRMARRIKGEDESVGIAPEAATQWVNDWKAFNEQRLTSKKALYMEAARRRRLREQAQRRLETQRRAIMRN